MIGCAHASFEARIEPLGPYRPASDVGDAARELTAEDLATVSVWRGTLPPGLILDGGQLVVTDPERFELVGRVSTSFQAQRALARSLDLVFYRYGAAGDWRNVFCNVQVPLGWVTAGLWTLIPTHYPCMIVETNGPDAVDRRREEVLEALVRGTKASGGNLLVVEWIGEAAPGEAILPGTGLQVVGGGGFAVRDRALLTGAGDP
jgi:hypothetical protein